MKEYIALWHIGDMTRGEIITLSDKEAKRFLALGAVKPVEMTENARTATPAKETAGENGMEDAEKAETETANNSEPEEAEDRAEENGEERIELDPLADITEAAETPTKRTRKSSRKGETK